jgi:hypothetical protein
METPMKFTNNAEFEARVGSVIGCTKGWHVIDPDLDVYPEAYTEFSPMGCDICVGGAGSITEVRIVTEAVDVECCVCDNCRYALEYGIEETD